MSKGSQDIDGLGLTELKALLAQALERISELERHNQALRDEVARLKGLKGRPEIKPSGMEKDAKSRSGKKDGQKQPRRRGSKKDKHPIDETKIVKAEGVPAGSRFKGYEDYVVEDLILRPWRVLFRRERWLAPDGRTIMADLPGGVHGHYGANLVRFVLSQHHHCQVTVPLIWAQLCDFGACISERQVMRMLLKNKAPFLNEARDVLRAGLESADWITVDDTGARHKAQNGYCTQIGNDHFAWFKTTKSKSRLNFLELLRAGDEGYEINEAALDYMRDRALPARLLKALASHERRAFADRDAWMVHLEALGLTKLKTNPDPVRLASEGALWGRISTLGLLADTVIVSDGAPQFNLGEHALCWVHGERLIHKLDAFTDDHCRAKERIRGRIWWLYADIKEYRHDPTPRRKHELRRRFHAIVTTKTGFVTLDRLLARMHAQKDEFLAVLERPDIPMHTNGSENDIRAVVKKRKISGGTRSDEGRDCRDAFMTLMKTCAKLGIRFWDYLGSCLKVPGAPEMPPLPNIIRQRPNA